MCHKFNIGARVRLKKGLRERAGKQTATVVGLLSESIGGRVLSVPLAGYRYWNVEDLTRALKRRVR